MPNYNLKFRGSENSESYAGHLDRQAKILAGPEEKKPVQKGLEKYLMLKFFSNIRLDCVNDPKNELVKSYYDLIGYTSLWEI